MAEAKSIEALAVFFTLGIAAGTAVSAGPAATLAAVLAPLIALPVLLRERIRRMTDSSAVHIMLLSFLVLGFFCALLRSLPVMESTGPLRVLARGAADALRSRIDTLPFATETTAPLLKAFLTADRSGLSADTIGLFRSSGGSHLLALSGLHMGIIYLLLDKLMRPWGNSASSHLLRLILFGLGGAFFVLMTGASPSIVRAYLFILIGEGLRVLHRPRKASRVLCLALLLQLVLDPSVIRSAGFQLSYLAMAGIFLLYPVLEAWYPASGRWDPFRRIWNGAALSISCQLFTAPLSWYYFHSFPRHFLLTNLTAIPLTTLLLSSAILTLLLDSMQLCPAFLIALVDRLSTLLLWILEVIASM